MLTRSPEKRETGPVGLDDRPRPARSRERIIKGLKQSAPFSSLQRRIIFFNLIGLAVLVAGMTYLSKDKSQLIEVYLESLRKQGQILAVSIAESASYFPADGSLERPGLSSEDARAALARLSRQAGARVRLFNLDRQLIADTYRLLSSAPGMVVRPLRPPEDDPGPHLLDGLSDISSWLETLGTQNLPMQNEVVRDGISPDPEVGRAARGQIAHEIRVNAEGQIIISLALPVRKLHAILGVIQLSTQGGDIERFVREERKAVLEIFFLAAIVSVLLSIVLANMIASPIRELAQAVRVEGASGARPLSPDRPEIPDMTGRTDEIGDLSDALIRMTDALYTRIGAIESFAADVAHEIKNPLTSLRSAVETMQYAKTAEQRQKLFDVIENDVRRMDRLLTDISNASRLDAELVRERMEAFDLGELVQMLADVTAQQAEGTGVAVLTELPPGGLIAHGLEGRLAQVFTNLLGNALSFSREGGTIRVIGSTQPDETVRVVVEDEGPGIPPENLRSIFERFYSQRPESEAFGGHSGLGLSISKQIVEAHGGRIWAENRPGPGDAPAGARFVVELPV